MQVATIDFALCAVRAFKVSNLHKAAYSILSATLNYYMYVPAPGAWLNKILRALSWLRTYQIHDAMWEKERQVRARKGRENGIIRCASKCGGEVETKKDVSQGQKDVQQQGFPRGHPPY
jgi:hypothetical protein